MTRETLQRRFVIGAPLLRCHINRTCDFRLWASAHPIGTYSAWFAVAPRNKLRSTKPMAHEIASEVSAQRST